MQVINFYITLAMIYSAEFHITMSSVELSQLEKCISISSSYHPMQKFKDLE